MLRRAPLLIALLLLLPVLAPQRLPAQPRAAAVLRDITVAVDGTHATITLLVDASVGTLVTEIRKGNAQLRARPMRADRSALTSARSRAGVRSVRARIERRDVLVVDVDLEREVTALRVVHRSSDRITVRATLGERTKAPAAPTAVRGGKALRRDSTSATKPSSTKSPASSRARRRWELSTIVIDAGHGGRDPGATGLGGVQEKAVTLAVARQLRKEIARSMPGVRVVLTRSDDSSLELFRRGQIANESNGRLFISIHCNAQPDTAHAVDGFECYILRPGKSEEAARVVAAENGAIRFEPDQEKYGAASAESAIVASMAQSAFARLSEQAAQSIRTSMRSNTKLADRGVHQAGFFVLVGASMPAVLVEIGYISSPRDVKILKSAAGQRSIAQAIAKGIVKYEKIYSAALDR
jgi:N-acetylmuramoyl-L-alanine amidase